MANFTTLHYHYSLFLNSTPDLLFDEDDNLQTLLKNLIKKRNERMSTERDSTTITGQSGVRHETTPSNGKRGGSRNWRKLSKTNVARASRIPTREKDKCIATDDKICHLCNDEFETFFDDDEDKWLLKDAVRVEGKVYRVYHPICQAD